MHVTDLRGPSTGPTVVLLHGQVIGAALWEPLVRLLPARLLIPDLPGHGRSGAVRAASFEQLHDRLEAALLAARPGPVHLVGFSIPCLHALALALRRKLEVVSIAMLGPILGADPEVKALFAGFGRALAAGELDLVDTFLSRSFPPDWAAAHPATLARVRDELHTANVMTLADELQQCGAMPDLRPRLGEVNVPVLLRVGDADQSTPPEWARDYATRLPRATLELVPGCGHLQTVQDLDGCARSLRRHLQLA